MGEIADALQRARGERARETAQPTAQPPGRSDSVYSRAVDVEYSRAVDVENPRAGHALPAPDADAPRHVLPRDQAGDWVSRAVISASDSQTAEVYRHCALRVSRELESRHLRSTLIVSALRVEGKTTTGCNLALAFATMSGGRRTALVDLDLRKPAVAGVFGLEPKVGVEGVLRGKASIEQVRVLTDLESLDLFPAAQAVHAPHEILAGDALPALIRELERRYDTVIIDSAPLLLVPDSEQILPHVGSCVAVLRAQQTRRDAFERMIEMLPEGKLLGSFINDARGQPHAASYGYYGSAKATG